MKLTVAKRSTEPREQEPPTLGGLVHGVVNSTASIAFSAQALRASGRLSELDLEALARIEQAASLVADTVKRFASAPPTPSAPELGATIDLYEICCRVAEERRTSSGNTIYCRAFGDSRGPWSHGQLVDLVGRMVDVALRCLGHGCILTLTVSGVGRHTRLSLHGLGRLSAEGRQACLDIPAQVEPPLGGLMTVTASQGPGVTVSMHLPR